jgi:predicted DNA-binding transcriptional regulator YafY
MTAHPQPLLTHRIRRQNDTDKSALARQWRLLEQLSSAFKGLTIKEMVVHSGVSEKTIRRDMAFLKQIGFDVVETVQDYGRKLFRIRHPSEVAEGVDARQGQYRSICDALQQLHVQAKGLGDVLLAADLEGVQLRVRQRCRKPKPR